MGRIITKIRYGKFGQIFLKEGSLLLRILRKCKRVSVNLLLRFRAVLRKEQKYKNILTVFETYLQDGDPMADSVSSDETIDVIVPIYNGYEYLLRLFEDLPKTQMKCRFILVDDKSPDERVHQLEREFVSRHENAVLLEMEENRGFVYTVNQGLSQSKNHVALVNTDTELPEGWLERLMAPILQDDKVASSTPYTNSGTIFSFPDFCYNNRLYRNKSVEILDSYFRKIKPIYTAAPTGVGFCMGMNKNAISQVGILDYETFGRGFGEENDWCQRAIRKGFRNVQVENLFVYHKHGGSFLSEEKERLIENHMGLLRKKHPSYDAQVERFIRRDPNCRVRQLMEMLIDTHETRSILYFDHSLGGGATSYLDARKLEFINQGFCVSVIRYQIQGNKYRFFFENGELQLEYEFEQFGDVLEIGKYLHFDEIYINELVTYPNLWETQSVILQLKEQQNSDLIMLFHDYFAACPTINLMGTEQQYCSLPETETCEACYQCHHYDREYSCGSRAEWTQRWKGFLLQCTEIRVFSEDTEKHVHRFFGKDLCLRRIPHQVEYAFSIRKNCKSTDTINIGLLGALAAHKGSGFIQALLEEIKRQDANIKIKLIGSTDGIDLSGYKAFSQTGRYRVEELPKLIYENDIDLFFIPAVWPETFSYTAEEIMKMGMPVAAFDLGAPAERIRGYEKGLIIADRDPAKVLEALLAFATEHLQVMKQRVNYKKMVFLAEYISFSSRYRMEHMWEELLYLGVHGEIWKTDQIPSNIDWDEIGAVVIYRCRYQGTLKRFMEEAKKRKIRIFYDIDDFIFNYEKIKDLPFMQDEEYKNFEVYSKGIRQCMENSDALLVSTGHLKAAAEENFAEKPVFVNRNVASAELLILSALARRKKRKVSDRVILGYFSGSHTHNRDFELISELIAECMEKYENVYFKVVGCLELPAKYQKLQNRVIRVGFMDWQKLPEEIAGVDINLMPLEQSFFHECKSENKWMEAALVKTPTIGSYTEELAGATRPEEDILLCRTEEEWRNGLERMIEDRTYRERMAESAYQYALEHKTTLVKHTELLDFMEIQQCQ